MLDNLLKKREKRVSISTYQDVKHNYEISTVNSHYFITPKIQINKICRKQDKA